MRAEALRLVLSGHTRSTPELEARLRTLARSITGCGLRLDLIAVSACGDRLTAAGIAVESPGRTATIYLSPVRDGRAMVRVSADVVRALRDAAWDRDRVLLQGLVSPDEPRLETAFAGAGFHFLAELICADRATDSPAPRLPALPDLEWLTYAPDRHDMFIAGLDLSYAESLDCPGLSGIRTTEEVLAGHRAAGRHDPGLWSLARLQGETVGVLLLAPAAEHDTLDLVYMGVARQFRRRGVAHALLRKCRDEALTRRFARITLAVDCANVPARALYEKWAFEEAGRRRAWIAVPPPQSPAPTV